MALRVCKFEYGFTFWAIYFPSMLVPFSQININMCNGYIPQIQMLSEGANFLLEFDKMAQM